MTQRLDRLKNFKSLTLESYIDELDSQLIAERILELVIQSAVDINNHIIKRGLKLPEANARNSFLLLKAHDILSDKLAEDLSKSVNFRNLLAHEYLEVDNYKVFEIIPKALKQYSLYVLEISQYLDSLENIND